MKELNAIFSQKLSEAVKDSGMNYAKLAEKLNISKATMSMYVHGKALPSLETFSAMCDVLSESADFLLGKKEYWKTLHKKIYKLSKNENIAPAKSKYKKIDLTTHFAETRI